ncbi:MAG TPA: serine/threonine-protein kinase [Trichormus sp.]
MRSDDQISLDKHAGLPDGRDLVGHMLGGKYYVLGFIGRGGMGSVYRVHHMFLNCDMALKLLDSARVADGVQIRRFQQEGIAANSLNHSCLVKIHDFGLLDSGQPYLVMDLVDGQTLAAFLKKKGPMSLKDINNVFAQVCFGLSYAHNERVVHRDIKPSNIMLLKDLQFDTEGSVKIVDFGLAKIATENDDMQALTRTGEVMGSPIYMSPEQCAGKMIDYRSDIYSLGCVLFEALTGTPPFIGESALRTMMLHQSEKAPTLKEASLGKDFPPGLERIVAKMLAKSPSDRYRDLGVVAHELAHACTGSDRVLEPKSPTTRRDAQKIFLTWPKLLLMIALSNLVSSTTTILTMHWQQLKGQPAASRQEQPLHTTPAVIDPYQAMLSVPELPDDTSPKSSDHQLPHAAEPIVSKIDRKDGTRKFQFPTITIGQVTGKWQRELALQTLPKDSPTQAVDARSTVVVRSDVPLTFEINLTRFPGLIHCADVYKMIGVNEFDGFLLKKDIVRLAPAPPSEHKFLTSVIEQAAKWTRLRAFEVRNLDIGASEIAAIDKLKPLKVFESRESTFDPKALAHTHFLPNAENVWVSGFPVTRYVKGSTRLTNLFLDDSYCTRESMMDLKDCPNLRTLSIVQAPLGDDVIAAIASLHQLTDEKIERASLSPEQVRVLLSNRNLHKLRVDAAVRQRATEAGIVDPRLAQIQAP